MYECMYWHRERRLREWVFRIMKCQYGCCGELFDQECCSAAAVININKESHVWQTAVAVGAGLVLLFVFILVIVYAVKRNNRRDQRIALGNAVAGGASNSSFTGLEATSSPPPPYTETQCSVFIINDNRPPTNHAELNCANGTVSTTSLNNITVDPPPAYSTTDVITTNK